MSKYLRENLQVIILITAIAAFVVGIFVLERLKNISESGDVIITSPNEQGDNSEFEEEKDLIHIDVQGAIKNPGVYAIEEGAIVDDVLEKAGGLTIQADLVFVAEFINRAQKLSDAQKIYIPEQGEASDNTGGSTSATGVQHKVNINTASLEQLDSLSGIGPSYAQKIIEGRPYSSIEDIQKVKGIGPSIFEKIKEEVTV